MNIPAEHLPILEKLCRSQPLAAVGSDAGSNPYVSLVEVAVTNDLRNLYFATPRATRKWAKVQIEHIYLVTRFQNVMEFHLTP